MDKNNIPPQFNLQQLQEYLQLMSYLTGEVPVETRVSQDLFNWFKEQRKSVAKNFSIPTEKMSEDTLSFMGVKLVPIIKIETK